MRLKYLILEGYSPSQSLSSRLLAIVSILYDYPCTDPGSVYCLCLPANCPDLSLSPGFPFSLLLLYSAHTKGSQLGEPGGGMTWF